MNERWNLDRIYTGFDDPNFEADLGLLKEKVAAITAFSAELGTVDPVDGLCRGIVFEEEISALANKLAEFAMLRQSADTKDPDAGSQMGRILGIISAVAGPEAAFKEIGRASCRERV